MFAEIAQDQTVKSLIFQTRSRVTDPTTLKTTLGSWTTAVTVNALLWNASQANSYISGKFKEDTTAVALVESLTSIDRKHRVADGTTYYSINYINDVADQGEAFIVELKEWVE